MKCIVFAQTLPLVGNTIIKNSSKYINAQDVPTKESTKGLGTNLRTNLKAFGTNSITNSKA
jgi:hypothetical protein